MNARRLSPHARSLLAPALLLLSLFPAAAVAGDPPMYELVGGNHPSWSPDNERIVYEAGGDIWTILAAGGEPPTQLTTHGEGEGNVSADWSPTGTEIVFKSWVRVIGLTLNRIKRMPATGGTERRSHDG
jgi:hypothetical protein